MVNAKTWNPAQIDQAIRRLEGIIRSGSYNPAVLNQLLNQLGEPGYINTWNPAELDQKLRTLLHDLLSWKTATGNPIQLRTNNGGLVQSCEVTFYPIQSGSGEPSPTNIRPISGRDSLVLSQFGKNKLSLSGSDTKTGNGITIKRSGYCFVLSGMATATTTFSYSLDESVNLNPSINQIAFNNNKAVNGAVVHFYRDSTDVHYWGMTPSNRVATTWTDSGNENINKITIVVNTDTNVDGLVLTPILCDKTTTDYKTTHTATFPETVYGGKYDFVSGKLTLTHKVVPMSVLDFSSLSTPPVFRSETTAISDIEYPVDNSHSPECINEQYSIKAYAPLTSTDYGKYAISMQTNNRIVFIDNTVENASQFATKYADTKLCYKLATPTEITLTPEEIELLTGDNVLWTDGDSIGITYKKLLLPSDVESLSKSNKIKEKPKTTRSKKKKEE